MISTTAYFQNYLIIFFLLVEATKAAVTRAGDVDLLVNNAGIFIGQSFLDTTPEAWDKVMHVNCRAALVVSQIVAKNLIARKQPGSIVNVSSQVMQT